MTALKLATRIPATTTYSFVVWDFEHVIPRDKHEEEKKKKNDEDENKEEEEEVCE